VLASVVGVVTILLVLVICCLVPLLCCFLRPTYREATLKLLGLSVRHAHQAEAPLASQDRYESAMAGIQPQAAPQPVSTPTPAALIHVPGGELAYDVEVTVREPDGSLTRTPATSFKEPSSRPSSASERAKDMRI